MIQKIIREFIKLETAYFLHGRCHYLHIYSQLGTLKRSQIKLSIQDFSKPALNFEKRTRPEKGSATRLGRNTENDKFEFGNLILENSKEDVVLGVMIDNKLTFDGHIKNICR